VIPEELLDDLELNAHLIFESVSADDEYAKNEPGDLEEARKLPGRLAADVSFWTWVQRRLRRRRGIAGSARV